jgi:hypothetical protein
LIVSSNIILKHNIIARVISSNVLRNKPSCFNQCFENMDILAADSNIAVSEEDVREIGEPG